MRSAGAAGPALVYVTTRGDAERVAEALLRSGLRARAYHAGRPAEERAAVQRDLIAGRLDRVVCTNAFGMGVDKADVRLVVHWKPPGSLEMYYQEAGRAGRDGEPSDVLLLWHPRDLDLLRRRVDDAWPSPPRLAATALRAAVRGERPRTDAATRALERLSLSGPYGGPCGAWRARRAALSRLRAVRAYLGQ